MNKSDFHPDTRYMIAWRDPQGRARQVSAATRVPDLRKR